MTCCNCKNKAVIEHLPSTHEFGDQSLWCFECFVDNFCRVSATVLVEDTRYKKLGCAPLEVEIYSRAGR